MPRHHIDFVAFDLTRLNHDGLLRHDPFTQLSRHVLNAVFVQIPFPSDLPVRQIQAQQIPAQQPDSQRLMMARENGVGEVVEVAPATTAMVTLTTVLGLIQTPPRAIRTGHAVGAAQLSDHFKALLIVDQQHEGQFHPWFLAANLPRDSNGSLP